MGVWNRNKNDALSVYKWILENKNSVFFSHDRDDNLRYHFILCIQMQWQFKAKWRWTNRRANSTIATFGTNHMTFHLFILMVFEYFCNGVHITWVITSRQK